MMEDNESTSASASALTPLISPMVSYQSTTSSDESSEDSKMDTNYPNENLSDADILARKLLACNDNEDLENIVMRRSLDISNHHGPRAGIHKGGVRNGYFATSRRSKKEDETLFQRMVTIISLALLGLLVIFVLLQVSGIVVGPPSQPVGPYKLVELQVRFIHLWFGHCTWTRS
jgi:hypothetical protein